MDLRVQEEVVKALVALSPRAAKLLRDSLPAQSERVG